ncbi:MAG: insulinase family protein [Oscillospiraceae bacterium]|nr:insulinase family protein [Oscillospiraceae bacterium]
MIQTIQLTPGVILRHYPDKRFKTAVLSVQFQRKLCREEAALNALLCSVLLRGTEQNPDLCAITTRTDELYGASVSPLMRRIGNIQTVGLFFSCLEDRFAMAGDAVLQPGIDLVREILLEPKLVNGCFDPEYVESEKINLIADIESELNDKRAYAAARMIRAMCAGDSFALSLRGEKEDVEAITAEMLYAHYLTVLRTSPVEIFYVGSADAGTVAGYLRPLAEAVALEPMALPAQTALNLTAEPREFSETMDINQGKLSMGFVTPITNRHPDFAAMQVFNALYGAGMTSKLFVNVREKLSLCYYAGSGYYGSKGVLTVSSGIDEANYDTAKAEILRQLRLTAEGQITDAELAAAKNGIISGLRATPDGPGALENFYGTASIAGMPYDLDGYADAIRAVTAADVARCAKTVKLHTVFFLKGEAK